MTDDDDSWWWRRWLSDEEDARWQAGQLTSRERRQIAFEIADAIGCGPEKIIRPMEEPHEIAAVLALRDSVMGEPEPVVREPEASYTRDRSGHRRPLRRR